jgi:glycine C-acetyltransferase
MTVHYELESTLSRLWSSPGVVVYSSGYIANLSVVSTLFGRGDLIVLDRHAHRSLYDGARLSGASRRRFKHNDLTDLDRILRETTNIARRLIVVESVYSMEGQIAPLPDLVELARMHDAFLLVDEAHAIGVLGERGTGSLEHFGLPDDAIDLRIGTLSKALSSMGGFVAAQPDVLRVLRYSSHGTMFSAALTPADAGAATQAVRLLLEEPERVSTLRHLSSVFRKALNDHGLLTMDSNTPIVPVFIGQRERTLATALALFERGIFVSPIVSPGVSIGAERIRCVVNAHHDETDLKSAAVNIASVLRRLTSANDPAIKAGAL